MFICGGCGGFVSGDDGYCAVCGPYNKHKGWFGPWPNYEEQFYEKSDRTQKQEPPKQLSRPDPLVASIEERKFSILAYEALSDDELPYAVLKALRDHSIERFQPSEVLDQQDRKGKMFFFIAKRAILQTRHALYDARFFRQQSLSREDFQARFETDDPLLDFGLLLEARFNAFNKLNGGWADEVLSNLSEHVRACAFEMIGAATFYRNLGVDDEMG